MKKSDLLNFLGKLCIAISILVAGFMISLSFRYKELKEGNSSFLLDQWTGQIEHSRIYWKEHNSLGYK